MPRDVPLIGHRGTLDPYRNFRRDACAFVVGVAHKLGLGHNEMDPYSKLTAVNITIARAQHLGPLSALHRA